MQDCIAVYKKGSLVGIFPSEEYAIKFSLIIDDGSVKYDRLNQIIIRGDIELKDVICTISPKLT